MPAPLPPKLSGEVFTVADAHLLGVGDGRLRRRDLTRPFHGVRTPALAPSPAAASGSAAEDEDERWLRRRAVARERARQYSVQMTADQFFSHVTAAILHGLPLPARLIDRSAVDVGTSARSGRRRGRGVIGHLIPADRARIVFVDGLRVAAAVDVWCQLATVLPLDELVMVGDALVCRNRPPATMAQLEAAVHRHGGLPGARRLREAFALVRPRTDSPRETVIRLIIVRGGLPEPVVNARLVNRFGAFMAFGDLAYLLYKILVEYDGGQHRNDEKQFHRDIDRLDEPMEEGWRVIRINKTHHPRSIVYKVRTALLTRGWTPPS